MVACTARLNIQQCLNPKDHNSYTQQSTMTKRNTKQARDKLKTVLPSGATDRSFFELVYDVVRQIPYGRVTSYGAIAEALGAKSSARMVGWAMNNAHSLVEPVPAHRVVNRQGMLTGRHHFSTPDAMEKRLTEEGIEIEDNRVKRFRELFWMLEEEEKKEFRGGDARNH